MTTEEKNSIKLQELSKKVSKEELVFSKNIGQNRIFKLASCCVFGRVIDEKSV
jgi:hypothetical protein